MARQGAETRLTLKMRKAASTVYGSRLVVVKYHGDMMGEAGVSDLLCSLDGIFVACEVKSPEASQHKRKTREASIKHAIEHGPTLKQRAFVKRALASGAVAGFAATEEQFMVMLACAAAVAQGYGPCVGHNLTGVDE